MSLQSQLLLIEQHLRFADKSLLPALQTLYVQSHPDAALAWSDLAWLWLHTPAQDAQSSLYEASQLLEQALRVRADCWQAHDGLCEVHHKLGHTSAALHYGQLSLDAKHALAMQPDAQDGSVGQPSAYARRYWNVRSDLKVVAYSLFGREAFYAEAAIRNAQDVRHWYPDWICRVYVGSEVSSAVKQRLKAEGAEVLMPPQAQAHLPGTVWRFMALDDLRVKTVLLRDADSLITEREVKAVEQWLASDCHAHVMRDHPLHSELMLAGLWGAQTQSLRGVGDALLAFFKKPFHPTHADQHFLREWVWPRIYRSVMQHDSAFQWQASAMQATQDFPRSLQSNEEHVGHAPTQWTQVNFPGDQAARPDVLHVQLHTAQGELLGDYLLANNAGQYPLRLPPHVITKIEAGQWLLTARLPMDHPSLPVKA
jgi:hypothetical protein